MSGGVGKQQQQDGKLFLPHKVLTPGPGAYTPETDRFGGRGTGTGGKPQIKFGSSKQRPEQICVSDAVVSPGPIYMPQKSYTSTLSSPPQNS